MTMFLSLIIDCRKGEIGRFTFKASFTGTTLKQTLGRPPITALAGTESLDAAKVLDSVTKEGLDSASVEAVPPTEVWS